MRTGFVLSTIALGTRALNHRRNLGKPPAHARPHHRFRSRGLGCLICDRTAHGP